MNSYIFSPSLFAACRLGRRAAFAVIYFSSNCTMSECPSISHTQTHTFTLCPIAANGTYGKNKYDLLQIKMNKFAPPRWWTCMLENHWHGKFDRQSARHTVTARMECKIESKKFEEMKKNGIAWIERAGENAKERTTEHVYINIIAFPGQSLYLRSNLITRAASIARRRATEGRRSIKTQSHKIISLLGNKRAQSQRREKKKTWSETTSGKITIFYCARRYFNLFFFFEFDRQWITQSFAGSFSLSDAQPHSRHKQISNRRRENENPRCAGHTLIGRLVDGNRIRALPRFVLTPVTLSTQHNKRQLMKAGTATQMCFGFSSILAVSPKVISFGWKKNYHFAHIDIGVTIFKWNSLSVGKWWIKWIINSKTHWQVQWRTLAVGPIYSDCFECVIMITSESRRKTIILRHLTFGISFLFLVPGRT